MLVQFRTHDVHACIRVCDKMERRLSSGGEHVFV